MGVCGRIIVPLPPAPTDYERDAAGLETAEFATANCFYRREALEAVGGFDERFTAAWREDTDLFFALLERGDRARAPEAVVIHPVRPARWGISIRQQRKSMFNALLFKKHPALYRERIQASPPLHYYGIVGALLVALVGMVSGRGRVTMIGGGLLVDTHRPVLRSAVIGHGAHAESYRGDGNHIERHPATLHSSGGCTAPQVSRSLLVACHAIESVSTPDPFTPSLSTMQAGRKTKSLAVARRSGTIVPIERKEWWRWGESNPRPECSTGWHSRRSRRFDFASGTPTDGVTER